MSGDFAMTYEHEYLQKETSNRKAENRHVNDESFLPVLRYLLNYGSQTAGIQSPILVYFGRPLVSSCESGNATTSHQHYATIYTGCLFVSEYCTS